MRALLTMVLVLCLPALGQQNASIPNAAELTAAQPAAIEAMAERITRAVGGDSQRATNELLIAAFEAENHATRYLLWRQAVELAERRGDPWLALRCDAALARDFGLEPNRTGIALLRRMAAATEDTKRIAAIAMAAMYKAGDFVTDADQKPMLAFYDVAVRAALRSDHAPLYGHVRDRLARLRAPRAIGALLHTSLEASPWPQSQVAAGLLAGGVRMLEPFVVRELSAVLDGFGDVDPNQRGDRITAAQLLALSARANHPQLRLGLLRCARTRLILGYDGDDEEGRRERCRTLVAVTEQLARADGLSRLRFHDASQRDHLAFSNGDWRVEGGLLIGTANGDNNFATHRVRFASMHTVVIRGGIRSAAGLNFRCKVGDVNLLLNWEVEPQNHLWHLGACHRRAPPALTAGQEHTIVIFTDNQRCHVCIDEQHLWTVKGSLSGTVSVYPSLGSEIFVREILVDGNPDGLVDAPLGVSM